MRLALLLSSFFVAGASEQSNQRAIEMVTKAIAAHGDPSSISFSFRGTHTLPLQNRTPDPSANPLPKEGRLVFASGGAKLLLEEHLTRAGVYTGRHRYVVDGSNAFDLNLNSTQYRPASATTVRQRALALLPTALLQDALRNAVTLRVAADSRVSFQSSAGQLVTLTIDGSNRVAASETLTVYPFYGDRAVEHGFSGYRAIGGVVLPSRRTTRLSGVVVETLDLSDVRIDADDAASTFVVPPDFALNDASATRAKVSESVREIAPDVWAIENIEGTDSKVMVVVFPDFLLVAGAPDRVSDRVIRVASERWPQHPIRYVVPTHHHFDHAGGVRAFIAAGATIITTRGSRDLFAQAPQMPWRIRPDALARAPRPAQIQVMEGKRKTIASGGTRVDLYDIGPTPHADEMIIVHVPAAGVLYQADLLEVDDDDPVDASTANEVTVVFLQRLEELRLDVRTIIGGEGRAATMEELREAVRLRYARPPSR